MQKKLEDLNEELKPYYNKMDTISIEFEDLHDKCYTIPDDEDYLNRYTLYEYCIILNKYPYIK